VDTVRKRGLTGHRAAATLAFVPSPPRDIAPGLHHVWVNATGDWDYFLDEIDRIYWIRRLVAVAARSAWTCIAFCQMNTQSTRSFTFRVTLSRWECAT
jgi:hypothetical protein